MSLIKSMVSSNSNEWETPRPLFDWLDERYSFTLDPCATEENAKCSKFFTKEEDGLSKSWANETVFMNPPYGGKTGLWIAKAAEERKNNCLSVCLIVSSTDRSYWHDIISLYADQIYFLRGRVKFGGKKTTAPFASAIVVFNPEYERGNIEFVDLRKYHQTVPITNLKQ